MTDFPRDQLIAMLELDELLDDWAIPRAEFCGRSAQPLSRPAGENFEPARTDEKDR